MKLRIKKHKYCSNKVYLVLISIILILSHKCFYLWLQDDYLLGSLKYSDISVVLSVLFAVFVQVKYGPVRNKAKIIVYLFLLISLISAFTANVIYNQSFLRGIFAQRCQIAYLILFLPIERLFEKRKICRKDVERIIYLLAWFELILCTAQYMLYTINGTIFLRAGIGVRYDAGRFYFDPAILLMVVFKVYYDFLRYKKNRVKNGIFIIWVAFYLMIITKMRAMTLCFLLTLIVGLIVWKGSLWKKILYIVSGSVIGTAILSRINIVKDLMSALANLSTDATYNVRNLGRATFISEFLKSPLTGRGYPSISSSSAYNALHGYLFVDNGIWGMIYCYGIVGILWWGYLWGKLLFQAWRIRKKQMSYLLYLAFYSIGFMTDFGWFWSATSSFAIMMAFLIDEERESKGSIQKKEQDVLQQ